MSPKEGWADLRYRLPDLNRAYLRQRVFRLTLLAASAAGMACAFVVALLVFVGEQEAPEGPSKASLNVVTDPSERTEQSESVKKSMPTKQSAGEVGDDPPARIEQQHFSTGIQ